MQPSASSYIRQNQILGSCALALAVLAIFGKLQGFGFVNFDDHIYVYLNSHVLTGLTWENFSWAWTTRHASNWHPLTWMSLQLDTAVFGTKAGGYHFTNVILHSANSVILFLILCRTTGAGGRSFVVAALFALHPLHVESVAWISERKDVLSTFFMLLAIWFYVIYAARPRLWCYAAVFVAMALGLLAKPMLVTLPCVLLLIDFWPLRRFPTSGHAADSDPDGRKRPIKQLVLEKLPLFVLAAASSIMTLVAQGSGGAVVSLERLPFPERFCNAVWTYAAYLLQMIWPTKLSIFYPRPSLAWYSPEFLLAFAAIVALTFLFFRKRLSHPYAIVGWLWYVGMLFPVIGIVQVGEQARADRYTYVPLIGLFIVTVWGVADFALRRRGSRVVIGLMTAIILVSCGALTSMQVDAWRDSIRLWSHAVEVTPPNMMAYRNLGIAFVEIERPDKAIQQFQNAVKIDPDDQNSHYNFGVALLAMRDIDGAIREFEEVVRINPIHAPAHHNLALCFKEKKDRERTFKHFRAAIQADPGGARFHAQFAMLLFDERRMQPAKEHFAIAIQLSSHSFELHYYLATAYLWLGEYDEAAFHFHQASRTNPSDALAYDGLARLLARRGNLPDALANAERAIELDQKQALFHYDLSWIHRRMGNIRRATEELAEARRIDPNWEKTTTKLAWSLATNADDELRLPGEALHLIRQLIDLAGQPRAELLDILAAAQAAVGKFDEAGITERSALLLAKESDSELAKQMKHRLELYESKKPFKEAATGAAQTPK